MDNQLISGNRQRQIMLDSIHRKCKGYFKDVLQDPNGIGTWVPPTHKPTLAILASSVYDKHSLHFDTTRLQRLADLTDIATVVASVKNKDDAIKQLTIWAKDPKIDGIVISQGSKYKDLAYLIPPDLDIASINADAEYDPPQNIAAMKLLHSLNKDIDGLHAVIVGYDTSLTDMLTQAGCIVTCIPHELESQLPQNIIKTADILISKAFKPTVITADMIKPGAIVIDMSRPVNDHGQVNHYSCDLPMILTVDKVKVFEPLYATKLTETIILDHVCQSYNEHKNFQ